MGRRFNIGILAHVDAGKTTLTERMLGLTGAVRSVGSVDDGTATTDWLEVERRRGISVSAACAEMDHRGDRICIIDTPGHVDFAGEVERSLSVLDGAVLTVTSVDGVQPYTEVLWRAAEKLGIPVIAVINKVDRTGSDISSVMNQLRKLTGNRAVRINSIISEGDPSCIETSLSEGEKEDMLLDLAGIDHAIEEKLFGAEDIPEEQLAHLFDRFYRLDTKGSPNGSGLGLSIAKSIVHQMGGILTVTSENHLVTFVATF